jgi:hypothetical protein
MTDRKNPAARCPSWLLLPPGAAPAQTAAGNHQARDRRRVADLSSRFAGWKVWSTPIENGVRCATRRVRNPPAGDDGTWAKTLIEDTWDDLEAKLAEQEAHDQELSAQKAGTRAGRDAPAASEPVARAREAGSAKPAAPWRERPTAA